MGTFLRSGEIMVSAACGLIYVPRKAGVCLFGKPGIGKSSVASELLIKQSGWKLVGDDPITFYFDDVKNEVIFNDMQLIESNWHTSGADYLVRRTQKPGGFQRVEVEGVDVWQGEKQSLSCLVYLHETNGTLLYDVNPSADDYRIICENEFSKNREFANALFLSRVPIIRVGKMGNSLEDTVDMIKKGLKKSFPEGRK